MIHKTLNLAVVFIALLFATSCNESKTSETFNTNKDMKAIQFRIARPTNNLTEIAKFYQQGLGLEILGTFEDHLGYDGIMFGMPDKKYHLEFTQHKDKAPLPKPTKENLIVFYFDTPEEYKIANERLQKMGIRPVEPENPYCKGKSETYEDPDNWRVILFNGVYLP